MRRMMKNAVPVMVALTMAFGGGAVTAVTAMAPERATVSQTVVTKGPPEDSRNFNCARHGNRKCGFRLDTTPNKPGGVRWYTADFKKKTFTLQAWRYR